MRKKKKGTDADAVEAEAGEEAPAAKGGKGNLVPAAVLAAGLLGGGWFMGGGSGGASGTAVAGATTTTTVVEGEVIALDPITLNLADNHFLKVGIAVQMKGGHDAGGGGGHGAPADDVDPTAKMAKALDEAITVFGGRTKEDLSSPAGREHAKEELSERVRERYHGEVLGVYFTEFVMQ